MAELKYKKEMHRWQNQGQNTAWVSRNGMRKTVAQLELNLLSNVRNSKMGFYRWPEKEV